MSHTPSKTDGLVLLTRSTAPIRHLRAFMAHHMPWCERGVVAIDCPTVDEGKQYESYAFLKDTYGDAVHVAFTQRAAFETWQSLRTLRDGALASGGGEYFLHVDQDEFIPDYTNVAAAVAEMRKHRYDVAKGWMACRLGWGLAKYSASLPTYTAFREAAPVRAEVRKATGFATTKCWLTKAPHVLLHDSPHGMRVHPRKFVIDHFLWTEERLADSEAKALQYKGSLRARTTAAELEADARNERFAAHAHRTFIPITCMQPGMFDYADVYRAIVKAVPAGGTFVELGVYRCKSLGYIAEYAALCGKLIHMFGFDYFSKDPTTKAHAHTFETADGMCEHLQGVLKYAVPHNTPTLAVALSHEAAARFEDKSVDAVWVDADHQYESVRRDVAAWLPKMKPGGVLAGHDLHPQFPGVERALRELGVSFRRISRRSWVATSHGLSDLPM